MKTKFRRRLTKPRFKPILIWSTEQFNVVYCKQSWTDHMEMTRHTFINLKWHCDKRVNKSADCLRLWSQLNFV